MTTTTSVSTKRYRRRWDAPISWPVNPRWAGWLEQHQDRAAAIQAHQVLWQHFIDQHLHPPKEIILDFDATDVPIHGDQDGRFFHGYYDHYCFLPLYVFCGRHLLVSYLRPSNIDGARHSWAILALVTRFIRRHWPDTRIIFRGDSGFAATACCVGASSVNISNWISLPSGPPVLIGAAINGGCSSPVWPTR